MQSREVYHREPLLTVLPLNWTRCRLGAFISLIGAATNDNTAPIVETVPYAGPLDRLAFGIANEVQSGLGQTGFRFIGLSSQAVATSVAFFTPNWSPFSTYAQAVIGDGASVANSQYTASGLLSVFRHSTSAGESLFAAFIGVDIALISTGATVQSQFAGSTTNGITDVSDTALQRYMLDTTLSSQGTLTGGWWASAPINMHHVYVRFPHTANRIRIHNLRLMNLSL